MKVLLTLSLFLSFFCTAAQDSILVKNSVVFDVYETDDYGPYDQIQFVITVYNNSKQKIPDLGVTSRSEHLNLFVNGEINNPISMYNGLEMMDSEHKITAGDSASYYVSWVLFNDAGITEKYGNQFTVQWDFMGIKSEIRTVYIEEKYSEVYIKPAIKMPEINPDREAEFNYLVSHGDQRFRRKDYLQAQKFYMMAWRIYMYDDYVNDQIEICEKKTGKIIP